MPDFAMKPPLSPVCPVPLEQQPIHEYQALRESWFYRWATLDWRRYLTPLLVLWSVSWLVAGPVAAVSFPFEKAPFRFMLSAAGGASLIPALALLRLYLGWFYVRDRLFKENIFYEESGWYDGQVWTKPEEVLQRDRLIVTYQIQPLLKRLQHTFTGLAVIFTSGSLAWIVFSSL